MRIAPLFCLLFFALLLPASAQQTNYDLSNLPAPRDVIPPQADVQLLDTDQVMHLNPRIKILEERNGHRLTLDQAVNRIDEFHYPANSDANFGFDRNGLWLHVSLANFTKLPDWVVNIRHAQLEQVSFYLLHNQQLVDYAHQGKLSRSQPSRLPAFSLSLENANQHDLFIRVESQNSARIIPLQLYPESLYLSQTANTNTWWGIFYGAFSIIMVVSLLMYYHHREAGFLAFFGYSFSLLCWQLFWAGHIQWLVAPVDVAWLSRHTDVLFNFMGLCAAWFTLSFLQAKTTAPRSEYLVKIVILVLSFLVVLSVLDVLPVFLLKTLVLWSNLAAVLLYLIAGFESYSRHYLPARYYIFAWSVVLSCALIGTSSILGLIPSNSFTGYIFQVGLVIQAAFMCVALFEKSRFEMAAEIEQITDDMRNNLELIEEQNAHLDIARKHAVKANEVKSQFLANVSHEIRTPLNAILGFSRELQSDNEISTDKREHAAIINKSATNLLRIINDVLDFSKMEAGKISVNSEPFSPEQLLEETISMFAKSAHDKGLKLIYQPTLLPARLIGDAYRIRQILTNLIGNAIKFTPTGYVKLTVTGQKRDNGAYQLNFEVEDTGIGISRNQLNVLFKAFSQVDDAMNRKFQGTGLGLVISQQLALLMDGDIQVESQMGQGSTFTAQIKTQILNSQTSTQISPSWLDKRIHIMDQHQASRQALEHLFRQIGSQLTEPGEETDFLIVTTRSGLDDEQLQQVANFPAKHKVLLRPTCFKWEAQSDLATVFDYCIEQPLMFSRLDSLISEPELAAEVIEEMGANQLPAINILAVDDMELNLRLLTTWFKDSAVTVTTSLSGKDAVTRCESEEFDLILMDVQMPNMDGVEASRRIRRTGLNSGTPIIAVTAHAMREEQQRLLSSGLDDYLPKPIDLESLINMIERWCAPIASDVVQAIDWQKASKASNSNEQLAIDMLRDFVAQLPDLQREIVEHAHQKDYKALAQSVHKLHGVSCYTGVPRLQSLCAEMEQLLHLGQHQLALDLLGDFNHECQAVINQSEHYLGSQRSST